MAWNIRERKTEHAGAKHGNGAYWGPKAIAKHASNKERRSNDHRAVVSEVELATAGADRTMISDHRVYGARHRVRRNTRRWCAGKAGRPHQFVLQEILGLNFGLPALHVWACSRCGRKAHNLKAGRSSGSPQNSAGMSRAPLRTRATSMPRLRGR